MFGLSGFLDTIVTMIVSGAVLILAIWWILLDRMPLDQILGKKKKPEKKISKKRSQNKTKKRNKKNKKNNKKDKD